MAKKWNLQDIRPAGARKPVAPRPAESRKARMDVALRPAEPEEPPRFDDSDIERLDVVDGNGARKKRIITTSVIAVVVLALGFAVNVMLSGADVTVYPKTRDVFVQADFTAKKTPQAGELGYELLSLEATGEKQVKATGKENVATQAEGKIIVYNSKSTLPQRLIKNTRFESPDGLIYRIKESIEVPGVTKDAKGNEVPGTVVATVFADQPGEKYNIGPTKFTVPGLKGTDQYDSVYGESTIAFTGGFEGEKYIIDPAELQTAEQALQLELRDTLLARLKEERPAGFIIYDDSIAVSFESLPSTEYGDSLATIKEKAKLQVPMFKESEFASFIAKQSVPDYAGDAVSIPNPESLAFTYTSATTTVSDISTLDSLEFLLKGNARLIWTFDENKLKYDLKGKKKAEATAVFGSYPAIANAQAEVRPFWEGSFPDDPNDIAVTTITDKK